MRQKLSDKVRAELLDLIDGGSIAPGELLPSERALMERFKVGRPAIREAMQSLETIGLIDIRHGGRARVAEPSVGRMVDQVGATMKHLLAHSPASLENLKEARATLERELARMAARKRSPTDIRRLRALHADHAGSVAEPARFRTLDGLFHREIASISGNPIFTALIDAVFAWLSDFHSALVSSPGLEDLTLAEHAQILDAITKSDSEAAAAAMSDHLLRANALYRQPLRS